MKTIVIDPVTRIEGHAKITIHLDDDGRVADTQFHVTQIRGFEKFCEGPAILRDAVDHLAHLRHLSDQPPARLAKACEAIMSVRVPPTAEKLREIMHCGQVVQSHALSFFHLSAPDLLLGFDCDPARRNVIGADRGSSAAGPRRHRAAQVRAAGDRGTGRRARASVMDGARRGQRAAGGRRAGSHPGRAAGGKAIALRTLGLFKGIVDQFAEEIAEFGNAPTMYAGLVDDSGNLQFYDGHVRFIDAEGGVVVDRIAGAGLSAVHRRGDGAAFVPEGALFPARRDSRKGSSAWGRWRG